MTSLASKPPSNITSASTPSPSADLIMKDLKAIEEEKDKQTSNNTIASNTSTSSSKKKLNPRILRKLDAGRSTSSAITPKTTSLGEDDSSDTLHRRSKSDEFLQLALGPNSDAVVTSSSVRDYNEDKLHSYAKAQVARSEKLSVIYQSGDPEMEEQILFDQRLCEDTLGVAVRKINSNGKSQLRYVKCIALEEGSVCTDKSHFSFGKIGRGKKSGASSTGGYDTEYQVETQSMGLLQNSNMKRTRALTWGNKNKVKIHLSSFVCVRKGKTTERTRKNVAPASHLLSLVTSDKDHPSLDLEAPTRLDRDKFARAFARFLDVPLEIEEKYVGSRTVDGVKTASPMRGKKKESKRILSAAHTEPGMSPYQKMKEPPPKQPSVNKEIINPPQSNKPEVSAAALKRIHDDQPIIDLTPLLPQPKTLLSPSNITSTKSRPSTSKEAKHTPHVDSDGELSSVSSLTAGFDHEIVDELHQVIHELRAELESSRAEAARAVKVAEQAIQSAESCTSKDWNSTVTHKAAEAAAQAQKRSAEAMARQRFAEERLASERKSAAFWRRQAELAEEEAGALHTRAAVSEVTRGVLEERIQSERRIWNRYIQNMQLQSSNLENTFISKITQLQNQHAEFELELASKSNDISHKEEEVKVLRDALMERINNSNSISGSFVRKRRLKMFRKSKKGGEDISIASSNPPVIINTTSPQSHKSLIQLHSDIQSLKYQYTLLRQNAVSQIQSFQIPINPFLQLLNSSLEENAVLRNKLAQENSMRRRLSQEVQDLRGTVRVYVRPKSRVDKHNAVQITSPQMIVLHRDVTSSRSFEFDRVLSPDTNQEELYDEMEEMVLGSLDGYAVCIMAYGQKGSGKTYSIIGDNYDGIFFQALGQLVTISTKRKERYKDVFTISILEVQGDRLSDFCAETELANATCSDKKQKLEIKTNYDGDTIVQGLVSIPISSLEEGISLWQDCVNVKKEKDDGTGSHLIITITSTSTNIATGVGTVGKLVFVDLASSNVQLKRSTTASNKHSTTSMDIASILSPIYPQAPGMEYKFINKSLSTLCDVVVARSSYARSVPYRNSTLTHLLRDYLEGDAKVLLLSCISCEYEDLQETFTALRFASKMKKIEIGKATKHTLSMA